MIGGWFARRGVERNSGSIKSCISALVSYFEGLGARDAPSTDVCLIVTTRTRYTQERTSTTPRISRVL